MPAQMRTITNGHGLQQVEIELRPRVAQFLMIPYNQATDHTTHCIPMQVNKSENMDAKTA